MTSADFAGNRENFCYRHPDRQSFVLCQRCLRTICPECQTQAAVGVICPECIAQQRRDQTPAQARAQRRWGRAGGSTSVALRGQPVVTYAIIAITAVFYVIQQIIPASTQWFVFYAPALYPSLLGTFEPWRLVTGALVHSSILHIGLNMLSLWMIGRIMEPLLGRGRFLALYLISALGGWVAVTLLAFPTPVLGASGAIFGLFGALVIIARHLGAQITGILVVLAVNLVIGFVPGFGISWQTHLGGLVAGAVVGLVFARTRRRDQRVRQIVLLTVVTLALFALMLIPLAIYG
ncbi:MAG: rhomboid family intramembrane serine protease [Microbacterium ginsengisoli]|uniref:rhomboid family intramembrane serine protease n=1 Tax=Microbacterium TaxID=33882 RepID=UPI0006FB2E03|nr:MULTISPECIES: rhomboid family intramembrane serine protease [unclassified Microbacterium]KQR92093.1 Rhomboid family protein [Microbacterium sp. Leaf347]KQS05849.1 Rhomboid family protein [Microbacterium sp. Leaf351]MBN9197701.1 rhomboid family intramembrane serine protease [Microbacterium ginsengisoli]OJU79376.1 MAG: rhomboid family intramembrane serine protease [Microbacterium sp. 71-23]